VVEMVDDVVVMKLEVLEKFGGGVNGGDLGGGDGDYGEVIGGGGRRWWWWWCCDDEDENGVDGGGRIRGGDEVVGVVVERVEDGGLDG